MGAKRLFACHALVGLRLTMGFPGRRDEENRIGIGNAFSECVLDVNLQPCVTPPSLDPVGAQDLAIHPLPEQRRFDVHHYTGQLEKNIACIKDEGLRQFSRTEPFPFQRENGIQQDGSPQTESPGIRRRIFVENRLDIVRFHKKEKM